MNKVDEEGISFFSFSSFGLSVTWKIVPTAAGGKAKVPARAKEGDAQRRSSRIKVRVSMELFRFVALNDSKVNLILITETYTCTF